MDIHVSNYTVGVLRTVLAILESSDSKEAVITEINQWIKKEEIRS